MSMELERPQWKRILGGIGFGALCFSALAAGTALGWANKSTLITAIARQTVQKIEPKEIFQNRDFINMLVVGADENRYYAVKGKGKPGQLLKSRGRSDVMKLYHIDFQNKEITGIAIPRDLRFGFGVHRPQKMNKYYEDGGTDLIKEAIETFLGVPVDRVIDLKYNDFAQIIDSVGGVEVNVPKDLEYDDVRGGLHIHLKEGWQTINGEQAIGFVRFRKYNHDYLRDHPKAKPDTDFDRQQRQQHLMLQLKKTIETNPRLLPLVANAAQKVVGKNLSADELAALILFGKKVGQTNIHTEELKCTDIPGTYDLETDPDELQAQLVRLHFIKGSTTP